jgi:hypothetical protein
MTQGRTLAAVAAAAAVAGWLVVRLVGESSPPAHPGAAASPAPVEDVPVAAAPTPVPGVSPGSSPDAATGDLPDLADAFTVLDDALLRDRHAAVNVLPDDFGASSIPSTLPYRRTDEFWQPMFARHEEAQ